MSLTRAEKRALPQEPEDEIQTSIFVSCSLRCLLMYVQQSCMLMRNDGGTHDITILIMQTDIQEKGDMIMNCMP